LSAILSKTGQGLLSAVFSFCKVVCLFGIPSLENAGNHRQPRQFNQRANDQRQGNQRLLRMDIARKKLLKILSPRGASQRNLRLLQYERKEK
jgi:hypothetical protein